MDGGAAEDRGAAAEPVRTGLVDVAAGSIRRVGDVESERDLRPDNARGHLGTLTAELLVRRRDDGDPPAPSRRKASSAT